VVYTNGFTELSEFQGSPSPALDKVWEESYDLLSRIPKAQADLLRRQTAEIPDDDEHYIILLDVFHSLHCLNELRKEVSPDYYPPFSMRFNKSETESASHLGE
jgi:hypothetical protein